VSNRQLQSDLYIQVKDGKFLKHWSKKIRFNTLNMDIDALEVNLWRTWKENSSGDQFAFLPDGNGLRTPFRKSTSAVYYKLYAENGKALLKFSEDEIYQIKVIDGRIQPATMIWIDSSGHELYFTSK
jgi:hypothetical protein